MNRVPVRIHNAVPIQGSGANELKKDLRRLVKSLLKEDRNNLELIVKFAELEYELGELKKLFS